LFSSCADDGGAESDRCRGREVLTLLTELKSLFGESLGLLDASFGVYAKGMVECRVPKEPRDARLICQALDELMAPPEFLHVDVACLKECLRGEELGDQLIRRICAPLEDRPALGTDHQPFI
jgi:hypothetical protein